MGSLKYKIIGFSGYAGAGKTTAARMLYHIIENQGDIDYKDYMIRDKFEFNVYSFGDKLKEVLSMFFGIKLECFYDSLYKDNMYYCITDGTFVGAIKPEKGIKKMIVDTDYLSEMGLPKFPSEAKIKVYLTLRALMQWFGTDVIRNAYPKAWINALDFQLNEHFVRSNYAIIDDCRFIDEGKYIEAHKGCVIYIDREVQKMNHSSERIYPYADITISNNHALEDLFNLLKETYYENLTNKFNSKLS